MASTERGEINDVIERVFVDTLGGAASLDEVFRELIDDLPEHLKNHVLAAGLKTAIGRYFRAKRSDGLPQAPEVNPEGVHKQLDLLIVPEYRYVIEQQLKRSSEFYGQAQRLADRCKAIHGVAIPLELLEETS